MTWETRDLPVLRAIVTIDDARMTTLPIRATDLAEHTGLEIGSVHRALRSLASEVPPYFKAFTEDGVITEVHSPTGAAKRAVCAWPTPEAWADRLIKALNEAADAEPDPVRKSKLRRAAEALGDLGRGVVTEVVAAVIVRSAGMG